MNVTKKMIAGAVMVTFLMPFSLGHAAVKKSQSSCSIPQAATSLVATIAGSNANLSWVNNYSANNGGYIVVHKEALVPAGSYWGDLYMYWAIQDSSRLSLTTNTYTDINFLGYKTRYNVVTYNACGNAVSSNVVTLN